MASRDKRLVLVVLLLLAAASAFVWRFYDDAFPQASLTLPLTRDQITAKAEAFLSSRGFSPSGFQNLTLFDPDGQARLYLERELGLREANRLMQHEAPVWRWRARWFRPPEKQEWIVRLRPDGQLIGFERRVEENAPGARLDAAAARQLAAAFLAERTQHPVKLIAEQRESRPARDDYVFTWEREDFRAKDATLRYTVVVQGDAIGGYQESLYIPEQWLRDFAALRSSNELYAALAQGFFVLLILTALALLLAAIRAAAVPWGPLLRLSLVPALFSFLNELNTLPFAIDEMSTANPYPQMVAQALLQALGSATGVLLYLLLPAAAGAALYAARFPGFVPIESAFTLRGMATRSFFRAAVAGFGFAGLHLAFLTAFYLVGARAGVWSPQDVAYSDVLATPIPWVYPVAIALMASGAEEFWFRLLAVPLVRPRWLAILLPAMVWGFLHANYPQQPGWIRGVEVGLIGIASVFLMQRFGIVATLVWHYVIDAFLIGSYLFQSETWLYRVHGVILAAAILAPLLISAVLYRRNGGFLPEPEPTTRPELFRPAPPADAPSRPPLAPRWPVAYLWLGAAAAVLLAFFARPVVFGDFVRIRVTPEQARVLAEAEMRRRNLDPAAWKSTVDFAPNLRVPDLSYLRERLGAQAANETYRQRMHTAVWAVRYFQPGSPEEWTFFIDQQGKLYRFDHDLDEKAPGAQLPSDQALAIGERALSAQGLAGYTLLDTQTESHDHRTDYRFVWEDPAFRAGDARCRAQIVVVGEEACQFARFFKLPEEWLRNFQRRKLTSYVAPAFWGMTLVPLTLWLIRRLATDRRSFPWRSYALAAAAALAAALIGEWNDWPTLLNGYDTSIPLGTYYGQLASRRITMALLTAAAGFLLAMAAGSLLSAVAPDRRLPQPRWSRAVAIALLFGAASQIAYWLLQQMPGLQTQLPVWELRGLESRFPAVSLLLHALATAFVAVCVGTVYLCGGLVLMPPSRWRTAFAFVVVAAALTRTQTPSQFPFALAAALLLGAALLLIVWTCAADLFSIGLGLFLALAASGVWKLAAQPSAWLRWNAALLALLAGIVATGVTLKFRREIA